MKKQNAKTVTTHARSEADRAQELAWRDEDDLARHEADCAAFEDLVDRTCESEG